jgi:hypothetical protein
VVPIVRSDAALAPATTVPEIVAPKIEPPGWTGAADAVGETGELGELLFPHATADSASATNSGANMPTEVLLMVVLHRVEFMLVVAIDDADWPAGQVPRETKASRVPGAHRA